MHPAGTTGWNHTVGGYCGGGCRSERRRGELARVQAREPPLLLQPGDEENDVGHAGLPQGGGGGAREVRPRRTQCDFGFYKRCSVSRFEIGG